MRMQNWATALMSLLGPLVVGSTTFAQPPGYAPPPGGSYLQGANYPDPYLAQTPMNPGVFQPQFGPATPALPPGTPPDFRPYPQISPHLGPNVMQDRTFNRNGQWLNQIISRDREWYGTVEYLFTEFEGGTGALIGSKTAPTDRLSHDFPPIDPWDLGGIPVETDEAISLVGPGAFPWVLEYTAADGWPGFAVVPNGSTGAGLYPIRSTSILDDWMSANGVRLRGGYFDEDGTGTQLEVWWGFSGSDFTQYGSDEYHGIPITQDFITGVNGSPFAEYPDDDLQGDWDAYAAFILSAKVGALPLIDNSGVGDFYWPDHLINGFTQRYDLLYRVDSKMNGGGGNLNFFLGDVYSRPHVSIKSFTGLKYLFMDEKFGFRGLDSGFAWTADQTTYRPADGAITGPIYPLFESILNSTVTSHLAGPEYGFRGDLGRGGGFSMWWQGSLGLMVNHERVRVQGNNIGNAFLYHTNFGDPTTVGDESGWGLVSPDLDMFANDTSFDSTETHTHVSPTISLGLNAEIGIFDTIPGLRKISLFEEAKLNVGYNILLIGMLARAADSVQWRGFPEFPSANVSYDTYEIRQFSIGLHFER